MKLLVGLCGPAGCGKNTAAKMISEISDASVEEISFAGPIKEMARVGLGIDPDIPRELKEVPLEEYGVSPRHIWQTLGTEWGREMVNTDIWLIIAMNRAINSNADIVLITDVRFPNEVAAIENLGGHIVHIKTDEMFEKIELSGHKSEIALEVLDSHIVAFNDKTNNFKTELSEKLAHIL